MTFQYPCNLKVKVYVTPDVNVRNWNDCLIATVLVSHPVFPVEDTKFQVLA